MGNILGKVLHDVFDYVRDAFALEGGEAGKWSQQRDILRNEVAKRGGFLALLHMHILKVVLKLEMSLR